MHPQLLGIPAYCMFIFLGIGVGITMCWTAGGQWGLSRLRFVLVLSLLVASALMGSKVQSVLERQDLGSVAWELANGFRYSGGVAGALAALFVLRWLGVVRTVPGELLDSLALAICGAMAVVRIGCFLEGCCFGAVSNGPFAITFPAGSPAWHAQVNHGLLRPDSAHSLPVHPLQLYFALWSALLLAALLSVSRRPSRPGTIFLLFLCADGFAHSFLEGFRFEPVQVNAVVGLLAGLGGAVVLAYSCKTLTLTNTPTPEPSNGRGVLAAEVSIDCRADTRVG